MKEIAELEPILQELYSIHFKLSQRLGFTVEERRVHGDIAEKLRPYIGLPK